MIYYLEQLMPRILRNTNKINKYFKECILFSNDQMSFGYEKHGRVPANIE